MLEIINIDFNIYFEKLSKINETFHFIISYKIVIKSAILFFKFEYCMIKCSIK